MASVGGGQRSDCAARRTASPQRRRSVRLSMARTTLSMVAPSVVLVLLVLRSDVPWRVAALSAGPSRGTRPPTLPLPPLDRRRWLRRVVSGVAAAAAAASPLTTPPPPAHAGGLLQFPVGGAGPASQPLKNRYHFMRAGPSELEMDGIYSTNPLFLTNRENAMDEESGRALVLEALAKIKRDAAGLSPTVAYHSLAANSMDTADLVARELKLGREKLLPEFTYLDPRGTGMWDSGDERIVRPAVWALDFTEGGVLGMGGRPPANTDGTPNETLHDQFIRLRQFLSLQESRTSGEIILVIFPDGTGPALMSCMIAGIPFADVHALEYGPGEVRVDITPESVMALYRQRRDDPAYLAKIEEGKDKLAALRQQRTIVGLKEQMAEQERLDIDAAYERRRTADAQRERERQQQREAQLQARRELGEAKERERREQQEARWNRGDNGKAGAAAGPSLVATGGGDSSQTSVTSMLTTAALGTVGLVFAAIGTTGGGDAKNEERQNVGAERRGNQGGADEAAAGVLSEGKGADTAVTGPTLPSSPRSTTTATLEKSLSENATRTAVVLPSAASKPGSLSDQPVPVRGSVVNSAHVGSGKVGLASGLDGDLAVGGISGSDKVIEDQLNQLVAAEQAMKDALSEASKAKRPITDATSSYAGQRDPYLADAGDDGDNDWLRALVEIRDAAYDDEVEGPELELVVNGDMRSSSFDSNVTEWKI